MGNYVIQIVGFANGQPCPYEGQLLEWFNPTAEVKGGFTFDIKDARKFASKVDAFEVWKTSIGKRPDGKPDRPLTAFTVSILPEEDFL